VHHALGDGHAEAECREQEQDRKGHRHDALRVRVLGIRVQQALLERGAGRQAVEVGTLLLRVHRHGEAGDRGGQRRVQLRVDTGVAHHLVALPDGKQCGLALPSRTARSAAAASS
jgi:hypothetical protein